MVCIEVTKKYVKGLSPDITFFMNKPQCKQVLWGNTPSAFGGFAGWKHTAVNKVVNLLR